MSCPDTIPVAAQPRNRLSTIRQDRGGKRQTRGGVHLAFAQCGQWQDVAVPRPSPPPTVSRRRVLLGGGGTGTAWRRRSPRAGRRRRRRTSTSSPHNSTAPAPTVELAADAAAARRRRRRRTALTAVASERAAHAQALSDEIARTGGQNAPTTTTTDHRAAGDGTYDQDAIAALRQPADTAAQLAAKRSGYRAGLSADAPCNGGIHGRVIPAGRSARSSGRPARRRTRVATDAPRRRRREPPTAPRRDGRRTPATRRAVRRDCHRARDDLRLRLVSAHSTPDVNDLVSTRTGRAPRSGARRPSRSLTGPLGRRRRCPRPVTSCRSRSTTRPTPPTWPCAWRRTPRSRGGRCSSRRPSDARTGRSR